MNKIYYKSPNCQTQIDLLFKLLLLSLLSQPNSTSIWNDTWWCHFNPTSTNFQNDTIRAYNHSTKINWPWHHLVCLALVCVCVWLWRGESNEHTFSACSRMCTFRFGLIRNKKTAKQIISPLSVIYSRNRLCTKVFRWYVQIHAMICLNKIGVIKIFSKHFILLKPQRRCRLSLLKDFKVWSIN